MRELQDRASDNLVSAATQESTHRVVDAQHLQLRGEDHHADRRVIKTMLEPPTHGDRTNPSGPPEGEPDERDLHQSDRDRSTDTETRRQSQRQRPPTAARRDRGRADLRTRQHAGPRADLTSHDRAMGPRTRHVKIIGRGRRDLSPVRRLGRRLATPR